MDLNTEDRAWFAAFHLAWPLYAHDTERVVDTISWHADRLGYRHPAVEAMTDQLARMHGWGGGPDRAEISAHARHPA
jgi:hypothetical protein